MAWHAGNGLNEESRRKSLETRRKRTKQMLIYTLVRLGQGATHEIIAAELHAEVLTVRSRITRAIVAYGTTNRLELFAQFVRDGVITGEMLKSTPRINDDWFYRVPRS